MEFAREPYSASLVEEILPLLVNHYREVAHFQDIELKPDFAVYANAEADGRLRIFTARGDERLLQGYAIFFVRANPHYRDSVQGVQDILFLREPVRKGLAGYRFIKWCDEQLKGEGVQAVYHHVKRDHDFGPVLERMGYQLVDLIYTRRLD